MRMTHKKFVFPWISIFLRLLPLIALPCGGIFIYSSHYFSIWCVFWLFFFGFMLDHILIEKTQMEINYHLKHLYVEENRDLTRAVAEHETTAKKMRTETGLQRKATHSVNINSGHTKS